MLAIYCNFSLCINIFFSFLNTDGCFCFSFKIHCWKYQHCFHQCLSDPTAALSQWSSPSCLKQFGCNQELRCNTLGCTCVSIIVAFCFFTFEIIYTLLFLQHYRCWKSWKKQPGAKICQWCGCKSGVNSINFNRVTPNSCWCNSEQNVGLYVQCCVTGHHNVFLTGPLVIIFTVERQEYLIVLPKKDKPIWLTYSQGATLSYTSVNLE